VSKIEEKQSTPKRHLLFWGFFTDGGQTKKFSRSLEIFLGTVIFPP